MEQVGIGMHIGTRHVVVVLADFYNFLRAIVHNFGILSATTYIPSPAIDS